MRLQIKKKPVSWIEVHLSTEKTNVRMKTNSSKNIKAAITAVGGFVPKDFISNQDLEKILDTTDEWITSRTGIKKRHILKGEGKGTSHLAIKAAEDLINKSNINPESIDLVISMLSAEKVSTFELTDYIKNEYPDVPIVMLTPFSREVTLKLEKLELRSVDYVFSWLGNADILLAIIKLIEDNMNVDNDVDEVGVQAIFLLVVFLSKTVFQAFLISSVIGVCLLIYDYNKRFKKKEEVAIELSKIFGLILLTFLINTLFYKFYNKYIATSR